MVHGFCNRHPSRPRSTWFPLNCAGAPLTLGVQRGILAGRQAAGVDIRGKTARLWERLILRRFQCLSEWRNRPGCWQRRPRGSPQYVLRYDWSKELHSHFTYALVQKFSKQGEKVFHGFFFALVQGVNDTIYHMEL